ncbi:MAG: elongation factor G [Alphaproteobacteria bacterium]|nr:elongation factor G [Alphaproteobacteria bacterium]
MTAHKDTSNRIKAAPRAIALVGPHGGGKTSLLESIAAITGAVVRKGQIANGSSLGDTSPQSRARQMSVEMNVLTTQYLGEEFTFLDCPGSIEFIADTLNLLPGIDAAVVVCEPDAAKAAMLQPFFKRLADAHVPHLLFVNKFDKARGPLRALLTALQQASDTPLLLRQIPIWAEGIPAGFVDLALERAFAYRPHAADEVVDIADYAREKEARFQMLEKLADHDENLMEELLGDIEPSREEVFGDIKRELAEALVVPALIGSAEGDNGVRRLLKSLRHDVPGVTVAAGRAGFEQSGEAVVQVIKTLHGGHGGKLSLVRVLRGSLKDGAVLHGQGGREARIGGIFALAGDKQIKRNAAGCGDTVALARMEGFVTGETLSTAKNGGGRAKIEQLVPVYRLALAAQDRKDEVKLSAAIAKLCEEDPSLVFEHNAETQDMILAGQGEIHLKAAVEKLQSRYGLTLATKQARVPYRETIRTAATARGRHKRQSGGHGQFGDVVLEIAPAPRGKGFAFQDRIKGGVVPKQWIGSVERGIRDYMKTGPLGFPVVDVTVALTDGSYHTVDSSDAAFQTAGRLAMSEGMPGCSPVLLEPIMRVSVHVPSDATAKVNALVSGRRGAPLGYDARQGWRGWDTVRAEMPLSEVSDLIVDLRSLTQGVGTYEMEFDRLAELGGKLADTIVATRKVA